MASVNKLELVIQVEAGQANAAVKSVGINFRDLERQAARLGLRGRLLTRAARI